MFSGLFRFPATACVAALAAGLAGCAHIDPMPTGPVQPVPGSTRPAAPPPAAPVRINTVVNGNLWSPAMEDRRTALERVTAGQGVEVIRTDDNRLRLVIPSDLAFAPHSATAGAALRPLLDTLASSLGSSVEVQVAITAHTDGTGSDPQNNTLSLARARAVRDYLVETKGVATPFIQAIGRGARDPVASNDTAAGRTRNRRMEIVMREAAGK
jgi:outer membrane protein OmpA-like peptidoglycan-associated protein